MFILIFIFFAITFYFYGTRNYDYWKKKGVKYEKPMFFFGSDLKQFIDKVGLSQRFANCYRSCPNEKYVGFFEGNDAAILIRDPELIKQVLTADFKHFHKRGLVPKESVVEPLLRNLFTGDGDAWKLMRQKLTPTFTSGKLKAMFPLIVERAEKLLKIAEVLSEADEVDVRELMARYTTDFIGAVGFGIDSEALKDENSDFRKLGKRVFTITKRDIIVSLLKRMAPSTFKNWQFLAPEIEKTMSSITQEIMSARNYRPSGRNDFIDMMLELKQKGKIVGESVDKRNADGSPAVVELELDDLLLASQVFMFFAAGFETSSSSSSFTLHALAYHPEAQALCQEEIDEVLQRYGGKLSFDAIKEMKYLEMCFRESLRVLPPVGFLIRRCVNKFKFANDNLTIDENMVVIISTEGMQMDEKYFDNPEEFKPERFHPDNIEKVNKYAYMPFGSGPRACIGERMGIMQSLAGIATILSKFTVSPSKSSRRHPIVDPTSVIVPNIVNGLPLALKLRK